MGDEPPSPDSISLNSVSLGIQDLVPFSFTDNDTTEVNGRPHTPDSLQTDAPGRPRGFGDHYDFHSLKSEADSLPRISAQRSNSNASSRSLDSNQSDGGKTPNRLQQVREIFSKLARKPAQKKIAQSSEPLRVKTGGLEIIIPPNFSKDSLKIYTKPGYRIQTNNTKNQKPKMSQREIDAIPEPEHKLEEVDIIFLSKNLGSKWAHLGKKIHMQNEQLETIDLNFKTIERKVRAMLLEWRGKYGNGATMNFIVRGLKSLDMAHVAKQLVALPR